MAELVKILFFFFFAVFFTGCSTRLRTKVLQDGNTFIVQENINVSPWVSQQAGTPFVRHELKETNYFFLTRTSFRFWIGTYQPQSLPADIPLELVVFFRGKALSHNAQQVAQNRAVWVFSQGKPLDARLTAIAFNVWPILSVLAALLGSYALFRRLEVKF